MFRRCSEWFGLFPVLLVVASGCGDTGYPTAEVQGKAVFDGTPVSGGTVTFTPVEADGAPRDGKSAVGTLQANGVFVLTTYQNADGAIVGRHRVDYSSPEEPSSESVDIEVNASGQEIATPGNAPKQETLIELRVAESSSIVNVASDKPNVIEIELERVSAEN